MKHQTVMESGVFHIIGNLLFPNNVKTLREDVITAQRKIA